MRAPFIAVSILLVPSILFAQQGVSLDLTRVGNAHEISWATTVDYNYQLDISTDLDTWVDTGVVEPGTGSTLTYGASSDADYLFYRVRETFDDYDETFLTLPTDQQEVDLSDGVCFAFDLELFPELPAKIRIYQRPYNTGDPWVQIGMLTEFAEIDDIKFVRGSAVWIADTEGEYEVRAAVINAEGAAIAIATRRVSVGQNDPPSISITTGPQSPSVYEQWPLFETTVTPAPGQVIRRVEFFDNNVWIGTDYFAPFGDGIVGFNGSGYFLLRGSHAITAKVYDSRGVVGQTDAPYVVDITGSTVNARPELTITSPVDGAIVQQGQSFDIVHTVNDPDGASDLTSVSAHDMVDPTQSASDLSAPFGDPLTFDTTGWQPGKHTIVVTAYDFSDSSYPHYRTIYIQNDAISTFAESLTASMVDESSAAPSNERFTGVEKSSGIFGSGSDSGLEIDNGVLLTTGSFALWNGGDDLVVPNGDEEDHMDENDDPTFGTNNEELGDDDLADRVSGSKTMDAAVLEFDVFCPNGQLEFEYQFGSEEYDEYVGFFNDGFMITVDDVLVTRVPDCSDIVAVNSVNAVDPINEHLYLDDDFDIDPNVNQANQHIQVEYDGMTIRLRAYALVAPNSTHRVKIAIADVDDDQFDSGLFVRESSIKTIDPQP